MSNISLTSAITCPTCGQKTLEVMPTDACQWFYECKGCLEILKPKDGDCCVYCSYGSVKCPFQKNPEHSGICSGMKVVTG